MTLTVQSALDALPLVAILRGLTPEEAVEAIRKGNRGVGALSHGWLTPVRAQCVPDACPSARNGAA